MNLVVTVEKKAITISKTLDIYFFNSSNIVHSFIYFIFVILFIFVKSWTAFVFAPSGVFVAYLISNNVIFTEESTRSCQTDQNSPPDKLLERKLGCSHL